MTMAEQKQHREPVELSDTNMGELEALMSAAVSKGIREAITEETAEQFWGAGLKVLQKNATEHAGRFVLGGVVSILRKLSLFLLLGGLVYALGGWTAMVGLFKTIFTSGQP